MSTCSSMLPRVGRPFVTYGLREGVDVRASELDARSQPAAASTGHAARAAPAPLPVMLNIAGHAQRAQRAGGHRRGERAGRGR